MDDADLLLPAMVKRRLRTGFFGRRFYFMPHAVSTNDVAAALAESGEEEGSVVAADFQTEGRGRQGRAWFSPAGRNLLFTLILRPEFHPGHLLPLNLVFSIAVARVAQRESGKEISLKWPNDVTASGRKLCGMLIESSSSSGRLSFALAGFGMNVNMKKEEFPPALRDSAISLSILCGRRIARSALLASILGELESVYSTFLSRGFRSMKEEYEKRFALRGRRVAFALEGRRRRGVIRGIAEDGGMVVETGRETHVLYDTDFGVSEES